MADNNTLTLDDAIQTVQLQAESSEALTKFFAKVMLQHKAQANQQQQALNAVGNTVKQYAEKSEADAKKIEQLEVLLKKVSAELREAWDAWGNDGYPEDIVKAVEAVLVLLPDANPVAAAAPPRAGEA